MVNMSHQNSQHFVYCSSHDGPKPKSLITEILLFSQVSLVGGVLCVLAGILCLISVSWSAAISISLYNDPLVAAALKREVGSSIYIGWASSALLLLGGALLCFICGKEERPRPSYHPYMPYSTNSPFSDVSSRTLPLQSDTLRSNNSSWMLARQSQRRLVEHAAQVHAHNSFNKPQAGFGMYYQPQRTQPRDFRV